jgi:hypothetical protein
VEHSPGETTSFARPARYNDNLYNGLRFIIAAHQKDPNFFVKRKGRKPHVTGQKERGLHAVDHEKIIAILDQMIHQYSRTEHEDLSDDALNLLSIFIEVEDISRSKYNYAMSENDRAFVLYLLESIFDTVRADASVMTEEAGPGGRSDAEIVNVLRHMQRPDSTLDGDQLNNRLHFYRMIRTMGDELIEAWSVVDDGSAYNARGPTPTEVNALYNELRAEFDQSEWAQHMIHSERTRVVDTLRHSERPGNWESSWSGVEILAPTDMYDSHVDMRLFDME